MLQDILVIIKLEKESKRKESLGLSVQSKDLKEYHSNVNFHQYDFYLYLILTL